MLSGSAQEFLNTSGVIEPDEDVLYFYAGGPFFAAVGTILTDRRVISYWTDFDASEFFVESATFSEVAETSWVRGTWADPTSLSVVRKDGSSFVVSLATEAQGDEIFVRRLEALTQGVSR